MSDKDITITIKEEEPVKEEEPSSPYRRKREIDYSLGYD